MQPISKQEIKILNRYSTIHTIAADHVIISVRYRNITNIRHLLNVYDIRIHNLYINCYTHDYEIYAPLFTLTVDAATYTFSKSTKKLTTKDILLNYTKLSYIIPCVTAKIVYERFPNITCETLCASIINEIDLQKIHVSDCHDNNRYIYNSASHKYFNYIDDKQILDQLIIKQISKYTYHVTDQIILYGKNTVYNITNDMCCYMRYDKSNNNYEYCYEKLNVTCSKNKYIKSCTKHCNTSIELYNSYLHNTLYEMYN
jgi:hypothetical protein